jgi:hypothetical protein
MVYWLNYKMASFISDGPNPEGGGGIPSTLSMSKTPTSATAAPKVPGRARLTHAATSRPAGGVSRNG